MDQSVSERSEIFNFSLKSPMNSGLIGEQSAMKHPFVADEKDIDNSIEFSVSNIHHQIDFTIHIKGLKNFLKEGVHNGDERILAHHEITTSSLKLQIDTETKDAFPTHSDDYRRMNGTERRQIGEMAQKDVHDLKSTIIKLREKESALRHGVKIKDKQILRLKSENKSLHLQIKEKENELVSKMNKYKAITIKNRVIDRRVKELVEEMSKLKMKNKHLVDSLGRAQGVITRQQEELTKMKKEQENILKEKENDETTESEEVIQNGLYEELDGLMRDRIWELEETLIEKDRQIERLQNEIKENVDEQWVAVEKVMSIPEQLEQESNWWNWKISSKRCEIIMDLVLVIAVVALTIVVFHLVRCANSEEMFVEPEEESDAEEITEIVQASDNQEDSGLQGTAETDTNFGIYLMTVFSAVMTYLVAEQL